MNRLMNLKKTARAALAFLVISGLISFAIPASAGFLSAYQVLKSEYSFVVDRIVAGGTTESAIKDFIEDLEAEVLNQGELTKTNFDSKMYRAFEKVIDYPIHRSVFRALLKSYGDEIDYTLDNRELHPDLVPIRNAVMKSLLGEAKEPPAMGGGGGGGTLAPNSDINQAIAAALDKAAKVIRVDVSGYPELVLPGKLLNDVSREGRTLVLEWNGLSISMPPGTNISGDDKLTLSAGKMSPGREAELAQKAGETLRLIGNVYEIKAGTVKESGNFTFTKPAGISLAYGSEEMPESLGLYFYNSKNLSWEKLSAEHDQILHSLRVMTNQPGIYALFAAGGKKTAQDPPPISSKFIDIQGHWAENDINTMYQKGLVSGVTSLLFEPERSITRAEFAAIMLRAIGEQPGYHMTGRFFDVPADSWYFSAVNKAAEVGIISGYSSTIFGPGDPITREQIAVIISRAMQLKGRGLAAADSEVSILLAAFADQNKISPWARNGVAFAVRNNIVKGRSAAEFAPQATATRAEAAAMVLRMLP